MSSERNIVEKLHESYYEEHLRTYVLKCRDDEANLMRLLEALQKNGQAGHTCHVVIDPDTEGEQDFLFDGDGTDKIYEINVD